MDTNWFEAFAKWLVEELLIHWTLHLVWLSIFGICAMLGVLFFGRKYKKRIADLERRADEREQSQNNDQKQEAKGKTSNIINETQAIYIIGKYLEPSLKGNSRAILIHQQFLDNFTKTTGAKLGEHEYNAELLHQWMQTNAARYLIENQGEMR